MSNLPSTEVLHGRTAIFTISSNNYMPYSRTLIDSSNTVHPNAHHFLCLADELVQSLDFYPLNCTIVPTANLNIPDFKGFAFRYEIMEFNTAVKPYMFLYLFSLGYENVVYFDPDIKVYQPIEPVFDALHDGASVVLTPHITAPAEGDTPPNDVTIMQAGIYNLGFIAFRRQEEVDVILRWWARRLRFQCLNAQEQGIFVDQKFIDLVPGFLDDVSVLRTPTLNVAYWNLQQRDLEQVEGEWLVNSEPLIFFHFSGYDPRQSHHLSKHTSLFLDNNSMALQSLLEDYKESLVACGLEETPRATYAYERFASGARIPRLARRIFRENYLAWEGDPFETFEKHLGQAALGTPRGSNGSICTHLMFGFWQKSSYLQTVFDPFTSDGVAGLVNWFIRNGHLHGFEAQLLDASVERVEKTRRHRRRRVPAPAPDGSPDISVIGYITADTGVGEAGRLTLSALAAGTRSVDAVDVSLNVRGSRNNRSCHGLLRDEAKGRVQIFNINADALPEVQKHMSDLLGQNAYRIAVPFWELAEFPDELISAFNQVDEIWAPTRFIQSALITKVDKPVIRMPIALNFTLPRGFERPRFDFPADRFIFLFSFDFLSFSERKNPAAVLTAFTRAFAGRSYQDDVTLVIKCLNSSFAPDELLKLKRAVDGRLDIRFIDRELSRLEMLGLTSSAHCVVSLHRSEGLGLLVAEAMALGVPVIATDYSATTELISRATGFPVDYNLIELGPQDYPYAAGQVWADPDLSHAAWHMRYVVEQAGNHGDIINRARRHVETEYGLATVMQRQNTRFQELGI